jgi:proteasome assembly chaperone (PAC2) family protein
VDDVEHVRWDDRPRLRRPVVVTAFEGWNDAADAASGAARYLKASWGAQPFAAIDPEEFYDFSSTRPQVRLGGGFTREIIWPSNELSAASLPETGRDVVVLIGSEPQLRWRTFCAQVVDVANELGAELVVTLGALLADVAHTRPVKVTGTAADAELVRLGLERSTYEGPTGIVGVLHDACRRAEMKSASLWAAVPHYVAATPSPKATLALVRRTTTLLSTPLVTADLEQRAVDYEQQVSEVVATDEEVAEYVRRLEEAVDASADEEPLQPQSGEVIAAEFERFLRDQQSE